MGTSLDARRMDTICGSLDMSNSAQSLRRHRRNFICADGPSLSFLAGEANRSNRLC
jgi:hypothetical protein